jgi:hypothetical protein
MRFVLCDVFMMCLFSCKWPSPAGQETARMPPGSVSRSSDFGVTARAQLNESLRARGEATRQRKPP